MYKKESPSDENQMRIEEFFLPFGGKLKKDNPWVVKAALIPWEEYERDYEKLFSSRTGAPALSFRIALGSLIIKETLNLTDRTTVQQIEENPYLQYFLGFTAYQFDAPFDHSMMSRFRKRIPESTLIEINSRIIQTHLEKSKSRNGDDDNDNSTPPYIKVEQSGTMVVDATCTPADISFPTDLNTLNAGREKLEKMVDILWAFSTQKSEKPRTHRKTARKLYLNAARSKRLTRANRRKAIRKQLGFVKRDLQTIKSLGGLDRLPSKQYHLLLVISEMYRQQQEMYSQRKHTVKDRIVNIFQPHIRPIVRGKTGKQTEFGAKISASIVDGFTTLDRISFDSYNESEDIENQVEIYNKLYGAYPKRVLADQIYQTRKNRAYCKKMGIKLSGKPLGRPPKSGFTAEQKEAWRLDECERVPIEGKFGQLKRRFSLDRIMAKLAMTTKAVLRIAFIVVNLERILYLPILKSRNHVFFFNIYQIMNMKRSKWVLN